MDFYKAQNLTDQPRAPPKLGGSPTAFLGSSDRTAAVTGTVFSRSMLRGVVAAARGTPDCSSMLAGVGPPCVG